MNDQVRVERTVELTGVGWDSGTVETTVSGLYQRARMVDRVRGSRDSEDLTVVGGRRGNNQLVMTGWRRRRASSRCRRLEFGE